MFAGGELQINSGDWGSGWNRYSGRVQYLNTAAHYSLYRTPPQHRQNPPTSRPSMASIVLSCYQHVTINTQSPSNASTPPTKQANQSGERLHSLTATMENIRLSSEEALRRRRQQQQQPQLAPPTKRPLADTTNHPVKRMNNGQKMLDIAPDWGGNEITPSPSLTGGIPAASTQMPPPTSTPAGYRDTANPLSLSNPMWGLKREVVLGLGACGIATMYPWQLACLSLPGLLAGEKNLVYTAPTSAGKSLVADVLMIRKLVIERKKAIVVVPYIAIVQEKTKFLKKVLEKVKVQSEPRGEWDKTRHWRGLNIVGFHSGTRSRLGWEEIDVAVCTIEKVCRFLLPLLSLEFTLYRKKPTLPISLFHLK